MPRPTTTDVEVAGQKFRLGLFDLYDSTRFYRLLVSTSARNLSAADQAERPDSPPPSDPVSFSQEACRFYWMVYGPLLDPQEFKRIQLSCLRVVRRYADDSGSDDSALPVMVGGKLDAELAADPVAVDKLVEETLVFNLSPFFVRDGGEKKTPPPLPSTQTQVGTERVTGKLV